MPIKTKQQCRTYRYKSLKSWKIDNIDLTQQFSLSIFTDFRYQSIKIAWLLSIFIDWLLRVDEFFPFKWASDQKNYSGKFISRNFQTFGFFFSKIPKRSVNRSPNFKQFSLCFFRLFLQVATTLQTRWNTDIFRCSAFCDFLAIPWKVTTHLFHKLGFMYPIIIIF